MFMDKLPSNLTFWQIFWLFVITLCFVAGCGIVALRFFSSSPWPYPPKPRTAAVLILEVEDDDPLEESAPEETFATMWCTRIGPRL